MSFIRFGNDEITSRDLGLVMKNEQTLPSSYRVLEEIDVPYRQDPVLFDTNTYAELTLEFNFVFESASVVRGISGYTDGEVTFSAMRPIIVAWFRHGVGSGSGFQSLHCDPYAIPDVFSGLSLSTLTLEGYMNDYIQFDRVNNHYANVSLKIKVKPYIEGVTDDMEFKNSIIFPEASPIFPIRDLVKKGIISNTEYFKYTIYKEYLKPNNRYYLAFYGTDDIRPEGYFNTGNTVTDITLDTKLRQTKGFEFNAWRGKSEPWEIISPANPLYDASIVLYIGGDSTWTRVRHDGLFAAYVSQIL